MKLSEMPILAEAQVRRLPRQFQEREALLVHLKREAARQEWSRQQKRYSEQLLSARQAKAAREEYEYRVKKWRERLEVPDPEGAARLQELVDEEQAMINRRVRKRKDSTVADERRNRRVSTNEGELGGNQ